MDNAENQGDNSEDQLENINLFKIGHLAPDRDEGYTDERDRSDNTGIQNLKAKLVLTKKSSSGVESIIQEVVGLGLDGVTCHMKTSDIFHAEKD